MQCKPLQQLTTSSIGCIPRSGTWLQILWSISTCFLMGSQYTWAVASVSREGAGCCRVGLMKSFTCHPASNIWKCSLPFSKVYLAIPLLGIHTEETRSERDTCTPMFITALFTIARTWKQPSCPSADEWIRKLWYIYTMEYDSDIKKNSFESVLMRWMKLEPIIQSEVSQKDKHQYRILVYIYMEFRKMVMKTLYVRQQKRHRCIEQSFGLCGRGGGWDGLGEWH